MASSNLLTRVFKSPILSHDIKKRIDSMLRVNHAGELGADAIYKGQLSVLDASHHQETHRLIKEMWQQEVIHLDTFNRLLHLHRTRPTFLIPLWKTMGYALGKGTAFLGKEAAMACTEAVETVIGQHYNDQLRELNALLHDIENIPTKNANPIDQETVKETKESLMQLMKAIQTFRDDELEHLNTSKEQDAHQAPAYCLLNATIQRGCQMAIWIAKRV